MKKKTENGKVSLKSLRNQELFVDSIFTDFTSMEMKKKHYSISLSMVDNPVDNHITCSYGNCKGSHY